MGEEESVHQDPTPQDINYNLGFSIPAFSMTVNRTEQKDMAGNIVRPVAVIPAPPASRMVDLDLNQTSTMDPSPLSLHLFNSFENQTTARHSAFQAMFSLSGENVDRSGGNMISVA